MVTRALWWGFAVETMGPHGVDDTKVVRPCGRASQRRRGGVGSRRRRVRQGVFKGVLHDDTIGTKVAV